jgi:hypothetical protein
MIGRSNRRPMILITVKRAPPQGRGSEGRKVRSVQLYAWDSRKHGPGEGEG